MRKAIQTADAILAPVEKGFALVAGVVILLMMSVVTAEVLARGLFNHPLRGNLDVVEQMMAVLVALGIAYCQSHFGNVRMTLISGRLEGRAKWLNESFCLAIALFVAIVLTKGSWANFTRAWGNGGDTPELGIPLWIGILMVTGALGLLAVRLGLQLAEALRMCAAPTHGSQIFDQPADPIETTPYE